MYFASLCQWVTTFPGIRDHSTCMKKGMPSSADRNRLVSVRGTVTKVNAPLLLDYRRKYVCKKCKLQSVVEVSAHSSASYKPLCGQKFLRRSRRSSRDTTSYHLRGNVQILLDVTRTIWLLSMNETLERREIIKKSVSRLDVSQLSKDCFVCPVSSL